MSELKELDAWEWITRMTQKDYYIIRKVKDHIDITEEDYEVLKVLYREWWMGVHPLFQTKMEGANEKVRQIDLFTESLENLDDYIADAY